MKVLSWNLNRRTRQKEIPANLGSIFASLEADTIILNEFVDGPSRDFFKSSLKELGYEHQAVSPTKGRHNQIFAASQFPFATGDIRPPQCDESAASNFLHLSFIESRIEIVGFRAPYYKPPRKREKRELYWQELASIMEDKKDRPILFTGDANLNPFTLTGQPDASCVSFHLAESYRVPNPDGEWSYLSSKGNGTRIDHVFHTAHLRVESPEYVTECGSNLLAGPKTEKPISDHAALCFTVVEGDE